MTGPYEQHSHGCGVCGITDSRPIANYRCGAVQCPTRPCDDCGVRCEGCGVVFCATHCIEAQGGRVPTYYCDGCHFLHLTEMDLMEALLEAQAV